MVASALSAGQVAIVGYNSEDLNNPDQDTISFVLLAPIGTGTQIFFTDRAWNGTSFAAAGGDEGTFTYTAGSDLPAGTVVTITTAQLNAAGIDLSDAGETIYAYQGAINAPTSFLFAADIADGNNTFNGSLVNTGLSTAANTAVAIDEDNASFAAKAHNIQIPTLLDSIADPNDWVGNDNSLQTAPNGNYFNTPDQQMWVMGSGGGNAFIRLDRDGASLTAEEVTHILQNTSNDGDGTTNTSRTWHPTDITFDTVAGKVFVADSDGNGHNRILQYNIADFLDNPGVAPQATILYEDELSGTGIVALQLDKANGLVYYGNDTHIYRIDYNTAAQAPEVVVHLGTNVFVQDFVMNLDANGNGTAYIVNSSFQVSFGTDNVNRNFLYSAAITPTSTTPLTTVNATQMEMEQNDTEVTGVASTNADAQAFPKEYGIIKGIDIDPETGILYFTTAAWAADHDGNGGTPTQTQWGGVWSYATDSNATGVYNNVWRQDGVNASEGFMYYIEVDTVNNRYYFGDQSGNTNAADDQAVWVGNLGGGTPTLFSYAANIQGLGPLAMDLQNAPTLAGSTLAAALTEASSGPGSGETTRVSLYSGLTAGDLDTPNTGDELTGARVRISDKFQFGATHQDQLRINGNLSGTVAGSGISYSYDSATGLMTLTGAATVAEYAAALQLVQFSTSGDDVTAFGAAGTRTVSASVFDGLLYSDEIHATVTVTGINDAPVNTVTAAQTLTEDGSRIFSTANRTEIQVSDVDANPATQALTVTLSVGHGTLTLSGVAGLTFGAGANGGASMTITGTANAINAALNGLVYTPTLDYFGADTLTLVTVDNGLNGTDPGSSGTGTNEQDSDTVAITVTAVADIVADAVSLSEDAGATQLDLLANDSFENSGRSITAVGTATHGTVSINDNGTAGNTTDDYVVYTADQDYNGTDSFTYTVTSGGVTETATATVTVTAVADIVADTVTVGEDAGGTQLNLLANDSFENSGRSITGVGSATHGTVSVNDNGTAGNTADDYVVYTADPDYNGTDSFTYTVTSGGVTETATATVTVTAVADIVADTVTVGEDAGATQLDLLANDSFESSGRSITAVGTATHGTVSINDNGTAGNTTDDYVVYTADPNYNGTDSFTYTVTSAGLTETATVSVTVTAVNDAPNVVNGSSVSLADIAEDSASPAGATVSSLFASHFSDADDAVGVASEDGFSGVAITANAATATEGTWQYFTGGAWTVLPALSADSAFLVAAADSLRFVPAANFNGPAPALTVHLVEDVDGNNPVFSGQNEDLTATGDPTRFSAALTLGQSVTAANDAPVASGTATLSGIDEDDVASAGETVATVFGSTFSDAADAVTGGSSAHTLAGVAITGNATVAEGAWQYHDGTGWVAIGGVTEASALRLAEGTLIRFVPAANFNGAAPALTAYLIDSSGGPVTNAAGVDVSVNGGTTAISDTPVQTGHAIDAVNDAPTASITPPTLQRLGGEILVNTGTEGAQTGHRITALEGGGWVVTWTDASASYQSGGIQSSYEDPFTGDTITFYTYPTDVKAQVFGADGTPLGGEIVVNTVTGDFQQRPEITALAGGGFAVTWQDFSGTGDTSPQGIKAQVFAANGTPVGVETAVNTATAGQQFNQQITALSGGGFVVTWQDPSGGVGGAAGDSIPNAIKAQVFDADGDPVGTEFLVNSTVAGSQDSPQIATLEGGAGFVIVWWDDSAGSANADVRAQIFSETGVPVGTEILLGSASGSQSEAKVAALEGGRFAVAWTDGVGAGGDIKMRVFSSTGVEIAAETLVNTATSNSQEAPEITALEGGGFVVTWKDDSQGIGGAGGDASARAVKAQLFDADGVKVGTETRVNTAVAGEQAGAQTAALVGGGFVITWNDQSEGVGGSSGDSDDYAVKAQFFAANGSKLGDEVLVNTATTGAQGEARLVTLSDGSVVVVWSDASGQGGDSDQGALKAQILSYNSSGGYNAVEGVPLDLKNAGLSVADLDAGSGAVTVTLSVVYGRLHVEAGTSGATIVSGNDSGSVEISGTIAQIEALLNTNATSAVSFTAHTDTPPASTTLSLAINDGGNTGSGGALGGNASATINIAPVNDAPVLDLDSTASGSGGTATFTESGGAVAVIGANLVITDPEQTQLVSAAVVLTNAKTGDSLSVDATALPAGISHSIDTSVAGRITVSFSGAASLADYRSALQLVQFLNNLGNPDTTDRVISVTANDGTDDSAAVESTVTVVPLNVAPDDIILADNSIAEFPADTLVGTLTATDQDGDTTLAYALVAGTGDTDNALFSIDTSGNLRVVYGLGVDYEQKSSYSIRVSVTDQDNESYEEVLTVAVEDVEPEDVTGDAGNNSFVGGAQGDTIKGADGMDEIHGGGAGDTIFGGGAIGDPTDAADRLFGDGGNDLVYGNGGDDEIYGNAGADTVYGGFGKDTIYGGNQINNPGDAGDVLHGREGDDTIYGNGGDDQIFGNSESDLIYGGYGNDTIFGGNQISNPTDAADTLYGNEGNDSMFGNGGADMIFGGIGLDTIYGGYANDTINGGAEADVLMGNEHDDTFVFVRGEAHGDTVIDFLGNGAAAGDSLRFIGYGAGAALEMIDTTHWKVVSNLYADETITFANAAAIHADDYTFA